MKTVLITGAGRGIGLALTQEFTQHGYRVVGTYRDEKSAKDLLKLAASTPSILPVVADVTSERTLGPLKEQVERIGTLDILINNSGVIGDSQKPLKDLKLQNVAQVFEVNTFGPMRICQLVTPFMKNGGVIAQITSLMGSITDNKGGSYYDYRMSKAALNMFNMCLSKEFTNLTCLALHPGWVQTDMGGAGATVPTGECARGLFKVITSSTPQQTGKFFDFTGKALPW